MRVSGIITQILYKGLQAGAKCNGIGKNQVDADKGRVTLTKRSINGGTTVLKPPLALCNKPGVPPVLINAQRLC